MKALLSLVLFTFSLQAEIYEVQSLEKMKNYFQEIDKDTLCVFDVDNVLICSQEPAFQPGVYNHPDHKPLWVEMDAIFSHEEFDLIFNLTSVCTQLRLVEAEIVNLIKHLHENEIKAVALTAASNRIVKHIDFSKERYQQLDQFGIDFSKSFPIHEVMVLDDLQQAYGYHPSFYKGILFCTCEPDYGRIGNTKGDVLVSFLKRLGLYPEHIIFVDDKMRNLRDVERSLASFYPDSVYTGLHYTAILHMPTPSITTSEFKERWEEIANEAQSLRN